MHISSPYNPYSADISPNQATQIAELSCSNESAVYILKHKRRECQARRGVLPGAPVRFSSTAAVFIAAASVRKQLMLTYKNNVTIQHHHSQPLCGLLM